MTPSRGIRRPKGTALRYLREHMNDETDECMLWPFSTDKDGYGYVWFPGEKNYRRVTVLACEHRHGPMPQSGMVAAHGQCHDIHCWNPRHLTWKTHYQNAQDRLRDGTGLHGEANHQAVLTAAAVTEIRSIYAAGGVTQTQLADRYGISSKTVSKLIRRERWKHLP